MYKILKYWVYVSFIAVFGWIIGFLLLFCFYFVKGFYQPQEEGIMAQFRLVFQVPMMKWMGEYLFTVEEMFEQKNSIYDYWSVEELEPYLNQLQPGDIFFTDTEGYLSSVLIPGDWKHAGVYVGDGKIIDASSDGVIMRDFLNLSNLQNYSLLRKLVAFRPNFSETQLEEFIGILTGQIGKPYDFDFIGKDENAFYCSELLWYGFEQIGFSLPYGSDKINRKIISPEDAVYYLQGEGKRNGLFLEIFYLEKSGWRKKVGGWKLIPFANRLEKIRH